MKSIKGEEPQLTWVVAVDTTEASVVITAEVSVVAVVGTPGVSSSTTLVLINTT